jgi:pimeloyl-ACP methyl ester carboxylesterase
VIAPDLRGYGLSDHPKAIRAYTLPILTGDVRNIIQMFKTEDTNNVTLVGHDWGGAIAWDLSITHPKTIDQLVAINGKLFGSLFPDRFSHLQWELERFWSLFSDSRYRVIGHCDLFEALQIVMTISIRTVTRPLPFHSTPHHTHRRA